MASRAVLTVWSAMALTNRKEHAYFFVTVIKSCVLRYFLSVSYNSSSEGFGLLLGPANTVVAMEKVDVGRTALNAGCGGPPRLSAGDMDRFMIAEFTVMRGSGRGLNWLTGVPIVKRSCDGLRKLECLWFTVALL